VPVSLSQLKAVNVKELMLLRGITKYYGKSKVLDNVDLHVNEGEILGIVGANGSGKSTLLNILSGGMQINSTGGFTGRIIMDGEERRISRYSDAIGLGIGMVHQELSLISSMDVSSNITLTREKTIMSSGPSTRRIDDFIPIDSGANHDAASKALEKLGISIDTRLSIDKFPVAIKQVVEIARELNKRKLRLLMLDEPTSSLGRESSLELLRIIEEIRKAGTSVIFISHRLQEVTSLCDRIVVLRDGVKVSSYEKGDFSVERLSLDMIGKSFSQASRSQYPQKDDGVPILEFRVCEAFDSHRRYEGINFSVRKGEILGITGLAGHGQSLLSDMCMGVVSIKGSMEFEGMMLDVGNVEDTIKRGIIAIVEDRKGVGLLMNRSIEKNIIFTSVHAKHEFMRPSPVKLLAMFDNVSIKREVAARIMEMNIKCDSPKQKVRELSGGNQQKVCFARALQAKPKVMFIGEPTRGIDIFSKELILGTILDINESDGTTIVISSSEIDELRRVCDRIVVMYEGRISAVLSPDDGDMSFGLALSGQYNVSGGEGR
jgi:simple sugar transport system ATP-binding protein